MIQEEIINNFTHKVFEEFKKSMIKKEKFDFIYNNKKNKLRISLHCCECYNGVWKENFFGSYGCDYKESGMVCPLSIEKINTISYEDILKEFFDLCDVKENYTQLSFF